MVSIYAIKKLGIPEGPAIGKLQEGKSIEWKGKTVTAEETTRLTKGKKLAIITDAPRLKAWLRLAAMKIGDFFDVVVTFEDTKKHKPDNLPFEAALRKLNLKPGECLMVGDWPERDIKGAKRLGMKTCFARYGNPKIKRSDADFEIDDIKELLKIAQKH